MSAWKEKCKDEAKKPDTDHDGIGDTCEDKVATEYLALGNEEPNGFQMGVFKVGATNFIDGIKARVDALKKDKTNKELQAAARHMDWDSFGKKISRAFDKGGKISDFNNALASLIVLDAATGKKDSLALFETLLNRNGSATPVGMESLVEGGPVQDVALIKADEEEPVLMKPKNAKDFRLGDLTRTNGNFVNFSDGDKAIAVAEGWIIPPDGGLNIKLQDVVADIKDKVTGRIVGTREGEAALYAVFYNRSLKVSSFKLDQLDENVQKIAGDLDLPREATLTARTDKEGNPIPAQLVVIMVLGQGNGQHMVGNILLAQESGSEDWTLMPRHISRAYPEAGHQSIFQKAGFELPPKMTIPVPGK
ncbi:MAG: hypothetical protein V1798_04845 [Pseudomonadota bacterium]